MQILLNIPEQKAAFFMEHLQQFSYVEATPMTEEKKPKPAKVRKKKKRTEAEFLEDLRGAIQELHDYQDEKIQLRTLDSLWCSTNSRI